MRLPLTSLLALAAAGCVQHPGRLTTLQPTPEETKRLIAYAWPYAQLAYNSYHPEAAVPPSEPFPLPERFQPIEHLDNDDIGLAFDVYQDVSMEGPPAYVVVFRGTEGGPTPRNCDWKHGNFRTHQQERAVGFLQAWIADRHITADQLTLVGHSLGGGIALHASYRITPGGPHVVVFNNSPRFAAPRANPRGGNASVDPSDGKRLAVVRTAEILGAARYFGKEANQTYLSIPCKRTLNVIKRHNMRDLAVCLTELAGEVVPNDATANSVAWIRAHQVAGRKEREKAFAPCGWRY